MKFTPIASSSRGNAYLVESDGIAPLLLEAGLPIRQLREKLRFGLSGLAGCLVSHEHGDHAKAVKDLLKAGVDCYMSLGTAQMLRVHGHYRTHYVGSGEIGSWSVISFRLEHDAKDPRGFLISDGPESLLFIPDTAYVRTRFAKVTIIAVECNHISDVLHENVSQGLPAIVGRRVRRNHMELGTLIKMLKANDLGRCREIWLLHLSDGNSDEARMIKEVQAATGVPVYAAGD